MPLTSPLLTLLCCSARLTWVLEVSTRRATHRAQSNMVARTKRRAAATLIALQFAVASASAFPPRSKYDVVILGTGLKECLLAGLLSQHGKLVLQLESSDVHGGRGASMDLQQLADVLDGPGTQLSEQKLGKSADYLIEREPKVFIAGGNQLQVLVKSGAWQHMNPPGFKRVQRSLLYRKRTDGNADVHRVLQIGRRYPSSPSAPAPPSLSPSSLARNQVCWPTRRTS